MPEPCRLARRRKRVNRKQTSSYQTRPATTLDADAIARLNRSWLRPAPPTEPAADGFLWGDAFTRIDLERIIAAGECAVATSEGNVVGYYLLDNWSTTSILREHDTQLRICRDMGLLPLEASISRRMQCAVDPKHQMRGLSSQMFRQLLAQTTGRYEFYFAIVSTMNAKIVAHLRCGWRVLTQLGSVYAIAYRT